MVTAAFGKEEIGSDNFRGKKKQTIKQKELKWKEVETGGVWDAASVGKWFLWKGLGDAGLGGLLRSCFPTTLFSSLCQTAYLLNMPALLGRMICCLCKGISGN